VNVAAHLPRGARTAIIDGAGRRLTFDELSERGDRLARGLRSRLGGGDRLVLLMPVATELYVVLLGLLRARLAAVVVDPQLGVRRADACLRGLDVRGVIGSPLAHALRLVMPELRGRALYASPGWLPLTERISRLDGPPIPQEACGADEAALLTFTSGTTGRPKAVLRTHGLLDAQRAALHRHLGVGPDDVALETLPIFALSSLAAGATVVFPSMDLRKPASVDPAGALATMRRNGVTVSTASPAFFAPIVAHLRATGQTWGGMRAVFTGGARVPATLLAGMREVFPNARVEAVYGSTEAEPVAGNADVEEALAGEADGRGALVGRPVPEVDLRITVPGTLERADDVGEILVAGAHVNPAYFRDDAANQRTKLREGEKVWHRTGDCGRLDAQGRLWLVGRLGEDVDGRWPFPVEARAEAVRGVRRAALMPGPLLCWEGEADEAAVGRAVELPTRRMARIPVDRRHNAKVDRPALAALLE
jgi:acyl-CoA synthetase (AMP-forming)/AMP-acid ligase II